MSWQSRSALVKPCSSGSCHVIYYHGDKKYPWPGGICLRTTMYVNENVWRLTLTFSSLFFFSFYSENKINCFEMSDYLFLYILQWCRNRWGQGGALPPPPQYFADQLTLFESSSNNLSKENLNTGVSREMLFQK